MIKASFHALALVGCLLMFGTGCGSVPKVPKDMAQVERLQQPPPGKALVNFLRPTKYGSRGPGMRQAIFDGSGRMLCDLPGQFQFQYVCDPGEHVFIAWADKVTVVKANTVAGKVYDVMVDVSMGWVRADIKLTALTKSDPRRARLAEFEKACRVLSQTRTAHIEEYETTRAARIAEIKRDFLDGDKKDRLQVLGPDDCR